MKFDLGNKYIWFELVGDTGKTQMWAVVNKSSDIEIGEIKWHGAWRQYIFEPINNSFYNNGCLKSILTFLDRINKVKRITSEVLFQ